MAMNFKELEAACMNFEGEHGMDAFLDAMGEIMQRRLARQGVNLRLDEDAHRRVSRQPSSRPRREVVSALK